MNPAFLCGRLADSARSCGGERHLVVVDGRGMCQQEEPLVRKDHHFDLSEHVEETLAKRP
jgi:hypothetical protein